MNTLSLNQMEQIEGGAWYNWVLAGATCILGAGVTVASYGTLGEVAGVACGASIAIANNS